VTGQGLLEGHLFISAMTCDAESSDTPGRLRQLLSSCSRLPPRHTLLRSRSRLWLVSPKLDLDMRSLLTTAATVASLAAPAWSWGAAGTWTSLMMLDGITHDASGHEITAAIAQIHLLPSAQKEICNILPNNFKCQLSGVAAWADKIRGLPQFK
jgi:hypothetical protein